MVRLTGLKARLVVKGYTPIFGLDYGDTFSPVEKMTSVRLFLSTAAIESVEFGAIVFVYKEKGYF